MDQEIDLSDIRLIVGLGNPGPKFSNTRHNAGAIIVEKMKREFPEANTRFLIPDTFMNESGLAVASISQKNSIKPEDILVIHDDIDLEPSEIKLKNGGGAGGHNGIRSIIESLGTDTFRRIRVGVGRPFPHKPTSPEEEEKVARYVLSPIPEEDQIKIDAATQKFFKNIIPE